MANPFINMFDHIKVLGDVGLLTVNTQQPGFYDLNTGLWIEGSTSQTSIEAVVQPAGPEDLAQLPQNERTNEMLIVFTRNPLNLSSITESGTSDTVTWKGIEYKIVAVENWDTQAQYSKHTAVRLGV